MDFTEMLVARGKVANWRYYYYQPSMPAAVIFIVLFALTTLMHMYQMFRTRTWFMIPFIIGGIFETVGYCGRAAAAAQNPGPYTLVPYIIQTCLLLVAPALFAASIYMELGRIVQMVDGDKALFIRRTWLTKLFVVGDILSFLVQAGGAGILSQATASDLKLGKTIIIIGLLMQIVFFGLFVLAAIIFHVRINKQPTMRSQSTPMHKHMGSLYFVSILIFIRSIIRVVEYAQGWQGYVITHEVFLYIFDATLMWIATLCMNWIHPSEVAAYLRGGRAFTNAIRLKEVGDMEYSSQS